jgi:hypothetical protein
MKITTLMAGVCCSLIALQANAGDITAGKEKSQACIACHGEGGHSKNTQFPKLAGQVEDYLVHTLKAYRDGSRKNAIMQGMAGALSDANIEDLSAYFNREPGELVAKH